MTAGSQGPHCHQLLLSQSCCSLQAHVFLSHHFFGGPVAARRPYAELPWRVATCLRAPRTAHVSDGSTCVRQLLLAEVVGTPLERSNVFRRQGNDLYCKAREVARNADPYTNLRGVQESVKLFQAAMAEYGKALHFLPNDHRLFGNRALCYQAVEDWVKCREDAQHCVKLKSDYTKGWLLLVKATWELGHHHEAMQELQNGLRSIPGSRELMDLQAGLTSGHKARAAGRSVFGLQIVVLVSRRPQNFSGALAEAARIALNYPDQIFHATARAARAHVRHPGLLTDKAVFHRELNPFVSGHVAGHFAGNRFGKISRVLQTILEISRLLAACGMAWRASHTSPKSPTSVLNGLVKKGQTDAALALLANLRAQHLLTTVAVNVVIAAAGRCYSWSLAAALLQDMRSCSLRLTVVSLNSLLSSMHPFSAWRQAASTVARERAITPDQITHNVLIKTCTQKRWEAAQAIVIAMRHGAVQPDQYTCSSLLSCESWPAAQVLLDHIDLDMACFRASIGRGTWERSLAVVSRMWTLGLRTDAGSFNALFTCLSRWHWAIRGLQRHTGPDLLRLNSIVDTCTKSGKWRIAVDVYSLMKASRLRPDIVAKNCVIQAVKHLWPRAVGSLLRMMDCRIAPDESSYRAVFEASGRLRYGF
ncbi:CRP1 [Symbiodinium sp. CCMP2456]|nr:CRP1 [Symbiodinium sp. CCMP2456]